MGKLWSAVWKSPVDSSSLQHMGKLPLPCTLHTKLLSTSILFCTSFLLHGGVLRAVRNA